MGQTPDSSPSSVLVCEGRGGRGLRVSEGTGCLPLPGSLLGSCSLSLRGPPGRVAAPDPTSTAPDSFPEGRSSFHEQKERARGIGEISGSSVQRWSGTSLSTMRRRVLCVRRSPGSVCSRVGGWEFVRPEGREGKCEGLVGLRSWGPPAGVSERAVVCTVARET